MDSEEEAQQFLKSLGPNDLLVNHNLKADLRAARYIPAEVPCLDSFILSWLFDVNGSHKLKDLGADLLGLPMEERIVFKKGDHRTYFRCDDGKVVLIRDAPIEQVKKYNHLDVVASLQLARLFEEQLDQRQLDWYWNYEEPYMKSLAHMENRGLPVDESKREPLAEQFAKELVQIKLKLFSSLGYEVNLNSDPQMRSVLYSKQWEDTERGLTGYRKSCLHKPDAAKCKDPDCTGPKPVYGKVPVMRKGLGLKPMGGKSDKGQQWKVDNAALKHHEGHPVVDLLLKHNEVDKLLGTYLLALPQHMYEGRVYGSFNQCGTATGRRSASEPNLQQVPRTGDHGKLIRSLFVAPPGEVMVIADLSQLELRLLADFSGDPALHDAFYGGVDVHSRTAERVGVTRDVAKTWTYGLVYGSGLKKAAQVAGQSVQQIKPKWDRFHAEFARVAEWKQEVIAEARAAGYVLLPSGRRRYLPWINSYDQKERGYAERQVVNTWPQGTGADLMKVAQTVMYKNGLVLNAEIHDEWIWCGLEEQAAEVPQIIVDAVQTAAEVLGIKVPIVVEPKIVRSWADKD